MNFLKNSSAADNMFIGRLVVDCHPLRLNIICCGQYSSDGDNIHLEQKRFIYDGWFLKLQSTTRDHNQPLGMIINH
jgi:hypothetical protein